MRRYNQYPLDLFKLKIWPIHPQDLQVLLVLILRKERDELKLTLEKLQNSSKSLNTLLNSQVSNKSIAGLGYKELIPESFVSLSELLEKQNNRSTKGYHEVPPPLTGNYMPHKHDLRLIDEYFESEYVDVSNVSSSAVTTVKTVDANHKGMFSKEEPKPVKKNSFSLPIIEDWVSETHSSDKRPFNRKTSFKNSKINNKVNTVGVNHVNTAKGKVVVNAVKGNGFNAVKASAFSNGLVPQKSPTSQIKIGTSSRRSLGEEDASKQEMNLKQGKQRSIFEERDFDVQAMIDANFELAARLRAKEQRRKPLTKA
nr:hypothetical protein [Tanacetum cinerariifolium]